jgi:hypothetical protein
MRRISIQLFVLITTWMTTAGFADAQEKTKPFTYEQLKMCLMTPPNNFKEGDDFVLSTPTRVDYFTHAVVEAANDCIAGRQASQRQKPPEPAREANEQREFHVALELVEDVLRRVENEHVDPVDTTKMFEGAVAGLLKVVPDLADDPGLEKAKQAINQAASGRVADKFAPSLDALMDLIEHTRKLKPPIIPDKDLVRWAIAGMLAAVDVDAAYLTPDGQFQISAATPARRPTAPGPTVVRSEGSAIVVRLPSFNEHLRTRHWPRTPAPVWSLNRFGLGFAGQFRWWIP